MEKGRHAKCWRSFFSYLPIFFIIAAHSRGRRRDHRLLVQVQQPITLPAVSAHTYWALPEKKRSSIEIVKIPHIEKT